MDVFIRSAVLEAVPNDANDNDVDIQLEMEKGVNFLGVVQRVKIGGKSLIVKTQPQNERRRELFNSSLLFSNEAQFYNRIRPRMLPLPKYLHVPNSLVAREDVLVFEDLCPRGFTMYPKGKTTCDLAHAKLIIKAIAGFHASSFALKHLYAEEYQSLKEVLTEVLFLRNGTPQYWSRYDNACVGTIKLIEKEFPDGGKYLDQCKKMLANAYDLFTSTTDPDDPYAIIVHGDLWMNNMLFRYLEKEPIEVVFLDFQIARIASPITDLVYFLYICTNGEFRKKHYANLMDLYYNSLVERLRILNINPDQVFPHHAFKDQLKKYSKYGFACGMIMVPIMFAGEDALAAFEDPDNVEFDKIETPEPIRKHIRDILVELVDMDYTD